MSKTRTIEITIETHEIIRTHTSDRSHIDASPVVGNAEPVDAIIRLAGVAEVRHTTEGDQPESEAL